MIPRATFCLLATVSLCCAKPSPFVGVKAELPVADYAPPNIERLAGLLFCADGWPGAPGRIYMPVDLALR